MIASLVSIDAARQNLGVSRSTIYELMACGALESVQIGRRRLIKAESITKLSQNGAALTR